VFSDRENKTVIVTDIAIPWTETEEVTKHENLGLEIKNIWKLSKVFIYPLVISVKGVVRITKI